MPIETVQQPSSNETEVDQYALERDRIQARRECLQPGASAEQLKRPAWALALSGGGIRSATFCLGVLQAMARARSPIGDARQRRKPLLSCFDYLSTVSGGGYIGSFLSSLFLPGRLRKADTPANKPEVEARKAANTAYAALRYEPPGRISSSTHYWGNRIIKAPGAWLRENGRYLTPTGSGDMSYAVAMTWRNWLSLHFMLGMPILLGVCLLLMAKSGIQQLPMFNSLFVVPWVVALTTVLPNALAYWLVQSKGMLNNAPTLINRAAGAAIISVVALSGMAILGVHLRSAQVLILVPALLAIIIAIALLIALCWIGNLKREQQLRSKAEKQSPEKEQNEDKDSDYTVRKYRVVVTRSLSHSILGFVALLLLATVATQAEEIYIELDAFSTSATFGVLPGLIWLIRKLSLLEDEKTLPTWLTKLPLGVLAMIGGTLLLLIVCLGWSILAIWLAAAGADEPGGNGYVLRMGILALIATAMVLASSRFPGFLNNSTLQPFYSARLTRAYLGASNRIRFTDTSKDARKRMSVAEPMSSDDLSIAAYYGPLSAGPLHLINVTMNLTVDPDDQLVQRDRKGRPLCIAPGQPGTPAPVSFILDGKHYFHHLSRKVSEINNPLTIGQWIGVSGAAFTTGLGRTTSLGLSLLLGLANVRLGVWWPARFTSSRKETWKAQDRGIARLLPPQTYLFYELTAKFHGHRRDYQYLSDGGHFENTAAYELVRPERNVELIVLCDCGCDPDYQFDDLANLTRLARIDHALEIREDTHILQNATLSRVFGRLKDFRTPPAVGDKRCAVMLEVLDCKSRQLRCRILLLKPRLISNLPPDIQNYAEANPAFPNQTTVDQFFDEAQFESYRQLGLSVGETLFGKDTSRVAGSISDELWTYLGYP